MIGQYAHGNEPSHHAAYIFNKIGQPEKTQRYIHYILTKLSNDSPAG
jgi:Putative alpha-1,2-mannosidase